MNAVITDHMKFGARYHADRRRRRNNRSLQKHFEPGTILTAVNGTRRRQRHSQIFGSKALVTALGPKMRDLYSSGSSFSTPYHDHIPGYCSGTACGPGGKFLFVPNSRNTDLIWLFRVFFLWNHYYCCCRPRRNASSPPSVYIMCMQLSSVVDHI